MRIDEWLAVNERALHAANIVTARLDCLVLLEDALSIDRASLLAHQELTLQPSQLAELSTKLARRKQHEPLAYIRNRSEFYGREFYVDAQVLEPRPESETIIDLLKQLTPSAATIADIGTGSGALAITARLELPSAAVTATDIDESCLAVAKRNATTLGASLTLLAGNLLEPFLHGDASFMPDILLCNLPYIPTNFVINQAATHEPALALFGGIDGLDLYRTLFEQTQRLPQQPSLILAESLPEQHAALRAIALAHGYKQQLKDGFVQAFDVA